MRGRFCPRASACCRHGAALCGGPAPGSAAALTAMPRRRSPQGRYLLPASGAGRHGEGQPHASPMTGVVTGVRVRGFGGGCAGRMAGKGVSPPAFRLVRSGNQEKFPFFSIAVRRHFCQCCQGISCFFGDFAGKRRWLDEIFRRFTFLPGGRDQGGCPKDCLCHELCFWKTAARDAAFVFRPVPPGVSARPAVSTGRAMKSWKPSATARAAPPAPSCARTWPFAYFAPLAEEKRHE